MKWKIYEHFWHEKEKRKKKYIKIKREVEIKTIFEMEFQFPTHLTNISQTNSFSTLSTDNECEGKGKREGEEKRGEEALKGAD